MKTIKLEPNERLLGECRGIFYVVNTDTSVVKKNILDSVGNREEVKENRTSAYVTTFSKTPMGLLRFKQLQGVLKNSKLVKIYRHLGKAIRDGNGNCLEKDATHFDVYDRNINY